VRARVSSAGGIDSEGAVVDPKRMNRFESRPAIRTVQLRQIQGVHIILVLVVVVTLVMLDWKS